MPTHSRPDGSCTFVKQGQRTAKKLFFNVYARQEPGTYFRSGPSHIRVASWACSSDDSFWKVLQWFLLKVPHVVYGVMWPALPSQYETQAPVSSPSWSPAVAAALTETLILLWWDGVTPSSLWWMRFIMWHKRAAAPPSSWQLYHRANVPKCHLLYAHWPSNFLIQFGDPLSAAQPESWSSNNNYTPRRLQNLQFPL